ncbi:phosphoglycolate phosphatase [Planctomycetales bacterium]|nr:phosphoglycolate phosphatase [Planctomycetales bacterium]
MHCIIFDFDGTIADTMPLCVEAFRQGLEPFVGRHLSDEEILSTFGPSEEGSVRTVCPNHYEKGLQHCLDAYRRLHPAMCSKPFDGITELLQDIRKAGIPLALVTGKGPLTLTISLEMLAMQDIFDAVETGSPHGGNKPECMSKVLQRFKVDVNDAVYIGDMPSDILACRKIGIPIYAAAWAKTADAEKLNALKPDKLVRSIQELRDLLAIPAK